MDTSAGQHFRTGDDIERMLACIRSDFGIENFLAKKLTVSQEIAEETASAAKLAQVRPNRTHVFALGTLAATGSKNVIDLLGYKSEDTIFYHEQIEAQAARALAQSPNIIIDKTNSDIFAQRMTAVYELGRFAGRRVFRHIEQQFHHPLAPIQLPFPVGHAEVVDFYEKIANELTERGGNVDLRIMDNDALLHQAASHYARNILMERFASRTGWEMVAHTVDGMSELIERIISTMQRTYFDEVYQNTDEDQAPNIDPQQAAVLFPQEGKIIQQPTDTPCNETGNYGVLLGFVSSSSSNVVYLGE